MFRNALSRLFAAVIVTALAAAIPAAAQPAHLEGEIGPGSLYVIDVPAAWNGSLILYAHGIVQADEPVALPSVMDGYAQVRDALLAAGFAVAASSFSSNGWSLDDAVRRTHQLGKIFVARVGQPRAMLLAGHSLGGLAIVKLAERFPGQYSGALAMCAPLGGALEEIRYVGDARVTFDYYFPGLLPGAPFEVPSGTVFEPGSPLFNAVYATLADPANADRLFQWAVAAGLPFAGLSELGMSALYLIGFQLGYTNDLIDRVKGKTPYDNIATEYQVDATADPATNALLSAMLNAAVARYAADPAAVNYYTRNYTPSGDISIPVVTLHKQRDPGVPAWHDELFAQAVAAAGRSAWLSQRTSEGWGHCAFTPEDMLGAFGELVARVGQASR